jgi:hypothetical protein
VDEVGLEVGLTLGEQLSGMDSRTGDNRRVLAKPVAESCVVRRLTTRTEEEVSHTADLGLYKELARNKH